MAQIKEICGKKYIEVLHSMESLDAVTSDNIYRFARKRKSIADYMEGYAAAKIDSCIMLYYSIDIIDIDGFVEFSINQCFRGD